MRRRANIYPSAVKNFPVNIINIQAPVVIGLLALPGLYLASQYSYLLFHLITEFFSITITAAMFLFAWNTRRLQDNDYPLFLGIAYLFIGTLDLAHTVSYSGMNVIPDLRIDTATQLWVGTRYIESISLLIAPYFFKNKLHTNYCFFVFSLITATLIFIIFATNLFPTCFVMGIGLTPFKKISEYLICLILSVAVAVLYKHKNMVTTGIFRLLASSIILTIFSELFFTFYISLYGISNQIGHYFKIISFYLIYRAIVATGLTRPYDLLFRNLKQNEKNLERICLELESRVNERTKDLLLTNRMLRQEMEDKEQAQLALKNSEQRYRRLFENSPVCLRVEDFSEVKNYLQTLTIPHGEGFSLYLDHHPEITERAAALIKIKDINKATLLLFNARKKEEFLQNHQKTTTKQYHQFLQKILKTIYAKKTSMEGDTILQSLDNSPLDVSIIWSATTTNKDCDYANILVSIVDLTQRKINEKEKIMLEGKLRHGQKMEALGTLAGGIAHDFNNILASISGYGEMILDEINDPQAPAYHFCQNILIAGDKAKDLVRHILAFSRQTEIKKIIFSPAAIIKETIKLIRASIPATIEIHDQIDPNCGTIFADPTQFHQIVMNLCTNAYQAMDDSKGILSISISKVILNKDTFKKGTVTNTGPHIMLSVRDTGGGIDKAIQEKIFDPYFTTKEIDTGTGLGLAIVHAIVEEHGGMISVKSEPGKGSEFKVYLPATKNDLNIPTDNKELPTVGQGQILFVDDDLMLLEMGAIMMEKLGYTVTTANNGNNALNLFENQPDLFDIVVTDMTMPGMTGLELAKKILAQRNNIPIILCTGFSHMVTAEKAKAAGIKEFILKPLKRNDLANILKKVTIK
ncbi:MAG: response regulator [Desulfobulbaceae bacterium]|nr:response regulator [Desulfobulbaceae bacterium]HIJ78749.1 response regulator [Deltaproteobacteria bacterium]